jgi:hypothetical protein
MRSRSSPEKRQRIGWYGPKHTKRDLYALRSEQRKMTRLAGQSEDDEADDEGELEDERDNGAELADAMAPTARGGETPCSATQATGGV